MVASTGQHWFAGLHRLVVHYFFKDNLTAGPAMQHALESRFRQDGAHAAALVINQEHERSRTENAHNLSHNSIGGNHRHIRSDPVVCTFIDVDRARLLAATGPDHLGRYRFRDELLLESQ